MKLPEQGSRVVVLSCSNTKRLDFSLMDTLPGPHWEKKGLVPNGHESLTFAVLVWGNGGAIEDDTKISSPTLVWVLVLVGA